MNTSNGIFEIMDNNDSSPAAKPVYKPLASTIMYSVAFILGTTGNGLVIYVTGCKMKKTVNTVWFLNLAVADFIFTAFLLFTIVSSSRHYDWPFGDFLCKLNTLVVVLNMFASIFILTAISVDRCLCAWVVVWAKNKRTPRKAEIICIIIWLAALGCSLPYAIPRAAISEGNGTLCAHTNKTIETFTNEVMFRFFVGFLIPFLIIALSYIAIGVRIRSLQSKKIFKSIRIILAVVMAFLLCWLPFHIFQLLLVKLHNSEHHDEALDKAIHIGMPLSTSLAFFNSCLNPFLYVFMCEDFKKKLCQPILTVLEGAFYEELPLLSISRTSTSVKVEVTELRDAEGNSQSFWQHQVIMQHNAVA